MWVKTTLVLDADGTDLEEFKQLKNIENHIVSFVTNGANLFIHSSNSGNGKSSWAIRLMQAYVDKTWNSYDFQECAVLFVSVQRLLDSLKLNIRGFDSYAPDILAKVGKADLVVWDDLAAKEGSSYDIDKLFSLIEGRLSENKANIFTSNLDAEAMRQALGPRIASRVCNGSINIELHGADKRYRAIKKF
jgi:DNA replication protein DnaC